MKEIKLNIPDGEIRVTVEVGEDGTTVTRYEKPEVKVEEKFQPKDGDILYGNSLTENIVIYKDTNEHGAILSYAGMTSLLGECHVTALQAPSTGYGYTKDYTRYATDEEKQRLFDALAKEGKRWNAEKKQIEGFPRWRAKKGEDYYYISEDCLKPDKAIDYHSWVDDCYYESCNYFKTFEAADRVVGQIREIFKNSKAE